MLIEFASFLRFPVKGQKRFEYSTYGFENEKKNQFSKISGFLWTRPLIQFGCFVFSTELIF